MESERVRLLGALAAADSSGWCSGMDDVIFRRNCLAMRFTGRRTGTRADKAVALKTRSSLLVDKREREKEKSLLG